MEDSQYMHTNISRRGGVACLCCIVVPRIVLTSYSNNVPHTIWHKHTATFLVQLSYLHVLLPARPYYPIGSVGINTWREGLAHSVLFTLVAIRFTKKNFVTINFYLGYSYSEWLGFWEAMLYWKHGSGLERRLHRQWAWPWSSVYPKRTLSERVLAS